MNSKTGTLYIVATPIGNLGDMTERGIRVLQQADLVLAEDTRRASILFSQFDIHTPIWSCHEHNERKQLPAIFERLSQGQSVALISDAGTPLISDPGFVLVREAAEKNIEIVPIPGASALIAALSASGLPTDRFVFEGFMPSKSAARATFLAARNAETATMVFYESSHRIVESLSAVVSEMGASRRVVVAREITKKFESFYRGEAAEVATQIAAADDHQKGEFVVMVAGAPERSIEEAEALKLLALLSEELPLKKASKIAAKWFGVKPNALYQLTVDQQK